MYIYRERGRGGESVLHLYTISYSASHCLNIDQSVENFVVYVHFEILNHINVFITNTFSVHFPLLHVDLVEQYLFYISFKLFL